MIKSTSVFLNVLSRPGLVLVIFLFIGGIIYLNSLNNPFEFDDDVVVVRNVNIREPGNIPRYFFDPSLGANDPKVAGHYRPLVIMSYAVNYALGGLSPIGYHIVNLAFHAGSAFLIFLMVKAMSGRVEQAPVSPPSKDRRGRSKQSDTRITSHPEGVSNDSVWSLAAIAAGLIFLVHPFNSEAVNYTTARSSVMSGFFYLLAFYFWVRYRSEKLSSFTSNFYIASLLAFVAGMLSKEVAVTLPVMLWLYDLYGFQQAPGRHSSTLAYVLNWRTYIPYLPFVLIVVVPYLMIRFFSLGRVIDPFQRDMITQLLTEIPVLVKHWQMFLLPRGLSIIHDTGVYSSVLGAVLLSGFLLILYIFLAFYFIWKGRHSLRAASFFMFWFFIVLLPTTIIPLNAVFQENRGYLAIVSFVVLMGMAIAELGKKISRSAMMAVLLVLLGTYGAITVHRNMVWGDSVALWKDTVEKTPRSSLAYAGLANAYRDRGDLFLSAETAEKGLSIDPNSYYAIVNLGRTYQMLGKTDRAIAEYEKALRIAPGEAVISNDLAILYGQKGDLEHAELYLKKAAEEWQDQPNIHYNLAVVMAGRGRLKESEVEFRKALSLNPSYIQARLELADTLEKLGRNNEAAEQYGEVIRLSSAGPDNWSAMLGVDRGVIRKFAEMAQQRLARLNRLRQ
ncbi:MAG: tetratricopeptide repeat protein [Nitrospirae bacterium]|nr:tetratricopeptide repeat protein [Nitrospirota bacterium]